MPTVTMVAVDGFAHCEDSMCAGNKQEPVRVVRTDTAWTFKELGGDLPGFERSTEMFAFADEDEAACGVCSRPRAATTQKRAVYPSQYDPNFLTKLQAGLIEVVEGVAQMKALGGDQAAMQAQIASLQDMVLRLQSGATAAVPASPVPVPSPVLAEEVVRRGPGRPRKDAA